MQHLTNLITVLMDSFCPIKEVTLDSSSRPVWFTNELKQLMDARNYFYETAKHERNASLKNTLRINFRRLRNKVNTLKQKLKSRYISKSLNPNLPSAVLWRNIKNLGVAKSTSNAANDFSPHEFISYFSSVFSKPTTDNFDVSSSHEINSSKDELDLVCVSDETIALMINQISTNAVGEDAIPAIFLKKLCPFIVPFITYIGNCCITKSYFPSQWKIANVRPIPKEPNPGNVSDFRPISILPCMSKILERVVKDQIHVFIDDNNLLYKFQSGFRKGHSTNSAMLKVVSDLSKAIESKCVSVITFLDFKKAFDLVDHDKLLQKLKMKFKFSSRSCKIIKSYLSNRWQRVCAGETISELIPVTSGTPQGGILSALLFSLFINDLADVVDCNLHLYADDSQTYCSSPNNDIVVCTTKMNEVLASIKLWAEQNSILINAKKSVALIVSAKPINNPPIIRLGDDVIEYRDVVRSLGLMLDNHLTWNAQIDKIYRETISGLSMLRQSQSLTPLATRKLLVQSLLIPKLTYCSNIFMGCSRSSWQKISNLFNSCVRYAFNLKKFASISSYKNQLLGCSIESYVHFRSCLFIFHLLKNKSPPYLFEELSFPRFPRGRLLGLPTQRKSKQMSNSFFVLGIHLWNSLSPEIRMLSSVTTFKSRCLSHFTSKRI